MQNVHGKTEPVFYSFSHTPSSFARNAFFYVQSIGHFCCDENYYTEREGYTSYLLIYTVSGKGYIHYREKEYEIHPGQVFIMNCYDYQKYYSDKKEPWEIKWVHFYGGTSTQYFDIIYENYGPLIDTGEEIHIQQYMDSMLEWIGRGDFRFEIKASSVILQMLTDIMMASIETNNIKKPHNSQVEAALRYIENNYQNHISLGDISKSACSSKYNFSRVFKRMTGYSPYEYLIKHRINMAKSLLKATDYSIDEIAGSVGFKSTCSFIKTFRELDNMTPLNYRKFWTG